jgi:hypothetical protein
MTRRDFLGALIGGMAVTAAGLYLPGTKVFSFPSVIVPVGAFSLESFDAILKAVYRDMVLDLLQQEPTFYARFRGEEMSWTSLDSPRSPATHGLALSPKRLTVPMPRYGYPLRSNAPNSPTNGVLSLSL